MIRHLQGDRPRGGHGPLSFRIGAIGVSVRSDLDEALEDFASLYHSFRREETGSSDLIHIEVRRAGRSLRGGRHYAVCGDGEEIGRSCRREEVLPYIEWGINWRVIKRQGEFLQLHAATLVRNGQGAIFAAASGSGKSTLAAGLLARGWKYLSDEFALLDPGTLRLHPFPKAVCIKAGSFDVIDRLNLIPWRRRYYVKAFKGRVGYLSPHEVAPRPVAPPSPVRLIVFPKYVEGAQPRLYPLTRAQAAIGLASSVLNRSAFGDRVTSILVDLVRGAECYGLECGAIEPTCDLVDALIQPALLE